MDNVLDALPPSDRRLVRDMAAQAGSTPEDMALEIVRAYLGLARSAPDALPDNPLRRLTAGAIRKAGC